MSGWDDYADFVADAERDTRVGDHEFLVEIATQDTWPSGDPRYKFKGRLTTANNAGADFTWSPPPSAAELKKMNGMEPGKKRAIAGAISLARDLEKHYGKDIKALKAGDSFKVKTVKTKRDEVTGKGGFIRVIAVLPPDAKTAAKSDVPF